MEPEIWIDNDYSFRDALERGIKLIKPKEISARTTMKLSFQPHGLLTEYNNVFLEIYGIFNEEYEYTDYFAILISFIVRPYEENGSKGAFINVYYYGIECDWMEKIVEKAKHIRMSPFTDGFGGEDGSTSTFDFGGGLYNAKFRWWCHNDGWEPLEELHAEIIDKFESLKKQNQMKKIKWEKLDNYLKVYIDDIHLS